jgi:CRISPR-associated protein Cas2
VSVVPDRFLVLAAYDVVCPRRLAAALQVVTGYAQGGQKSAYECWTTSAERVQLGAEMAAVLDASVDRWAVIPLGRKPRVRVLGRAVPPVDPPVFYFG